MARPPRFDIPAIADLLTQLRYVPDTTRRRQMDAAERLLNEIEPDRSYPQDYIVFRITSFRPASSDDGELSSAMLVGAALRADLPKFIERLSHALSLSAADYAPRTPLTRDEVLDRLGVSATTLHRYRREGLVAHQVVMDNGKKRLCFFEDVVNAFEQQRQTRVDSARRFTRIDPITRRRMIRRARRYRQSVGFSLNQAAERLSIRFDRSLEAVRQVLKRHDERFPSRAIFGETGPLTARQRAVMLRAHEWGINVNRISTHFGRGRSSVYRVINEERACRLNTWVIEPIILPTFDLDDAETILLSPDVVRRGFDEIVALDGDPVVWVEQAARQQVPSETDELAWIGALNYLLLSVARDRTRMLDTHHPGGPRAQDLDRAETRLRWADLLRLRLMTRHFAVLLRGLEQFAGQPLLTLPSRLVRLLHEVGIRTLADAVDQFNPDRGQRFESTFRYLLQRELATVSDEVQRESKRAEARTRVGTGSLVRPYNALSPWHDTLHLNPRLRAVTRRLDEPGRGIIELRFGLTGEAPRTCAHLASISDLSPERVAMIERRSIRQLRQLARDDVQDPR